MSNGVFAISNFLFLMLRTSQPVAIMVVMRYTKIILLNSKTSEVKGQSKRGVVKNKRWKQILMNWLFWIGEDFSALANEFFDMKIV